LISVWQNDYTVCRGKNVYFLTSQLKEVTPILCKLTAANQNIGIYVRAAERHHSYYN